MKKQIVITIVIIVAVLAGLAVGGYFMVNKSVKSAKAELNKTMEDLQAAKIENEKLQNEYKKLSDEMVKDVLSKDTSIIEADKKQLTKLFEPAFTWDDDESYEKARNAVIKSMGKTEFTDEFLIDIDSIGGGMKDENGSKLFGVKCDYKTFEIYPRYSDSGYKYFVFVDYVNYKGSDNKYKNDLNSKNITIDVTMDNGNVKFNSFSLASDYNYSEDMKYLDY